MLLKAASSGEVHFDRAQRAVPAVDLALACGEKRLQVGEQGNVHQREYRMRLAASPGDGEVGAGLSGSVEQFLHEIAGKER